MKRLRFLFCVGILCIIISWSAIEAQESATPLKVLLIEQAGYHADDVKMLSSVFKSLTGVDVIVETVQYDQYVERLLTLRAEYDVCAVDQIWLADLVAKDVLAPLDGYDTIRGMRKKDLASGLEEAFVYKGKTWAMPFLVNLQLLFYNEDLLKKAGYSTPPGSLESLVEYMRAMKEKGIVEYPWTDAWQPGESLITEFVWLLGAHEGRLFDETGQPVFDQEVGVKALTFMRTLLDEELASPSILNNDDLSAKDDFLAGRAAFTSSWIFLQGLIGEDSGTLIKNAGKMGLLPASKYVSTKTSSVISTQGLAILQDSSQKEHAWQWVQFFTSLLVQRAFMYEMPVWTSIQTSEDAQRLDPGMPTKRDQLSNASLRPTIVNYDRVSSILQTYIYAALEGSLESEDALKSAKDEVLQVLSEDQ
jgi:multiple sugar transport system substrate-binding protein